MIFLINWYYVIEIIFGSGCNCHLLMSNITCSINSLVKFTYEYIRSWEKQKPDRPADFDFLSKVVALCINSSISVYQVKILALTSYRMHRMCFRSSRSLCQNTSAFTFKVDGPRLTDLQELSFSLHVRSLTWSSIHFLTTSVFFQRPHSLDREHSAASVTTTWLNLYNDLYRPLFLNCRNK